MPYTFVWYRVRSSLIDKETKAIAKLLEEWDRKRFKSQEDITKSKLAKKRAKAIIVERIRPEKRSNAANYSTSMKLGMIVP